MGKSSGQRAYEAGFRAGRGAPKKKKPSLNPVVALHLAPAVGQPEVSIRTAILAGVEITGGLE